MGSVNHGLPCPKACIQFGRLVKINPDTWF